MTVPVRLSASSLPSFPPVINTAGRVSKEISQRGVRRKTERGLTREKIKEKWIWRGLRRRQRRRRRSKKRRRTGRRWRKKRRSAKMIYINNVAIMASAGGGSESGRQKGGKQ